MEEKLLKERIVKMSLSKIYRPAFTKITDGIDGAEGPVFDKNGRFFVVAPTVEKNGKESGQILQLKDQELVLICEPNVDGNGGIPAGCQCDQDNNLWVADMRLGILVVKTDEKNNFYQLSTKDSVGVTMQGCNDCIFDYHGNLWVTAPAGDISPNPYRRSFEEPFGSVYCVTKEKVITKVASNMLFPNGVAVQHKDGQPHLLIVAETPTKSLWAHNIEAPGKVSNKRLWGKLPGEHEGGPDGMDFDEVGNLLVANWGGSRIEVFSPEGGNPICRISCPFEKPSNVHFEPNSTTVYVTEHDNNALWKFDWQFKGQLQYCDLK